MMQSFIKKLVDYLGIDEEELLERSQTPKKEDVLCLTKYPEEGAIASSFNDFDKAVKFIADGIKANDKIAVYGDYDVDGLTSTTIIHLGLKLSGLKNVGFYIPSRYDTGYGLNISILDKMIKAGYKRIIAVDNGITKKKEIQFLLDHDVKVLVLDHHEEQKNSYPPFGTDNCLIYHRNDVSAACLALVVMERILMDDSLNLKRYVDRMEAVNYFFTLASLAVFSDCMSLNVKSNLALVKLGLIYLNKGVKSLLDPFHQGYSNIARLVDKFLDRNVFTYHDINFSINSKLNSIARVKGGNATNIGVYYLEGDTTHNGADILDYIDHVSIQKKIIVQDVMNKGELKDLNSMYLMDLSDNDVCPSGLSGLLANRLMDTHNLKRPILVFCKSKCDENDVIASFRSTEEYSLDKIIDDPEIRCLLKDHGGHAQACGFSFDRNNKDEIISKLTLLLDGIQPKEINNPYMEISFEDIGMEAFNAFESLEPFGIGFEKPRLGLRIKREFLASGLRKKHILLPLNDGASKEKRKIVFFNGSDFLDSNDCNDILLIGEMVKDEFRNTVTYSFKVDKALPLY